MSLGGRPKEEGGHVTIHVSINRATAEGLKKVEGGEKSKFIENALRPILQELDPPEASVPYKLKALHWLRIADRQFAEEYNLPRLTHPEDVLPTFLVEGKLTHPLNDILPAFTTRAHQR